MSIGEGAQIDIAGARWQSASGTAPESEAVVEVAFLAEGHVALRDGRDPEGSVLIFTPGEWDAFTAGVLDGEFDPPA
ncbi:DUF397 domain-containing protein [Nocardia sp. NPDC057353]|uniref:DUF397 domain-containing protein n=1 Tax=Nocardia sp. NPDC057353 TaxID=3346104 RepID=UPI0036355C0E